jgi:endonuclease/exonuclease/phosphatase family metal-dependent hydrolase
MREKTHSILRSIFLLINIGIIFLYLLVCLTPFINTGEYWWIALPGLAFPLLCFAMLCFLILWAILKSKWFWVTLIVLLLGIQQILAVFSFHIPQQFSEVQPPNTLRILHWNVEGWDEHYENLKNKPSNFYPEMMNLIKSKNADILCFEEYADLKNINDSNSTISTIKRMGYPYFVFSETDPDVHFNPKGVIIFSKYRILHSDTITYGNNTSAEHLIYIDIKPGKKEFRIFTTHLQSVRFESSDYESISRLRHAKDPGYKDSRTVVSKLKKGYKYRYEQAKIVKAQIAQSPYPAIITGDFNDVPNSNTYFTIKGKLQDCFLEKGFFIGRTFRFISPTLRIDYILANKSFKVNQFRVIHVPFSDHYPIEADLEY